MVELTRRIKRKKKIMMNKWKVAMKRNPRKANLLLSKKLKTIKFRINLNKLIKISQLIVSSNLTNLKKIKKTKKIKNRKNLMRS
jgi:hypothetical protein